MQETITVESISTSECTITKYESSTKRIEYKTNRVQKRESRFMPKKILSGSFTAPAELLQPEERPETSNVISENDYRNQGYKRQLDDGEKTYKQRLEAVAAQKNEPSPKRIHGSEVSGGDPDKDLNGDLDGDLDKSKEIAESRKPEFGTLTDDLLDKILPPGYIKVTPETTTDVYIIPEESNIKKAADAAAEVAPEYSGIEMKKEDVKHFSLLLKKEPFSPTEKQTARAMELVLRAKNGTQTIRKRAVRSLNSSTRALGALAVFGAILPMMLEPDLEDGDRHLLAKLCARAVYQLSDKVRPFTHRILVAAGPMLIDEDMTLRIESRAVVAAVAKAAGLANVVAALRADLDHTDEYVRNITARVFAVVAGALGLVKVLPFVRAVMRSQKSTNARHTGIRIVHHICVDSGGGNGAHILPFLPNLLDVLAPGLSDDLSHVRTATANTVALLADSVLPYGIEAFEGILEPAWAGLKHHRGRALAAFLRAIGSCVPLMAHNPAYTEYAAFYSREVMAVMAREFALPDDDMKKAVLRVLSTMPVSRTVFPDFRSTVVAPFFRHFWTRRVALEAGGIARLVVDATCRLAGQLDPSGFLVRLAPAARDANELLRRMAADAIARIVTGAPDSMVGLDEKDEAALVDAVLVAFQEQKDPHRAYLAAARSVCLSLGLRLRPHVPVILSTVLFRMKHSDPDTRLQAADLVAALAPVVHRCADETTIRKLVLFLYELLGEVYPEVLGSVIGALHACIDVLRDDEVVALDNPSMAMLLPTLTPILKNRHEKVQEQCIRLVGLIARKNAERISAKEWMRVCFDLLDTLKSPRKRIRVAANATFGHIASTIGPQDVLAMLLNNLRVQERQLRVCTAVAIGIVADTCAPFTVLPAVMNEYRVPDRNVRNGVLKALSFLFEYIDGSTARNYLSAMVPLIDDALTDRDQVHRQTAATVVRHMALNCVGLADDSVHAVFVHWLNLVLPNIYESSPHVIIRIIECVDSLRLVVGNAIFLNYVWPGLFHPARRVRSPFWKLYNHAYVNSCDSMVPFYPRVDSLPDCDAYTIDELDIWL